MKKNSALVVATLAFVVFSNCCLAATVQAKAIDGKKEFEEHCNACHPNGSNTINPAKPLQKKSLEAHGVKNAKDIIGKMRNPGPGMTRFDTKMVSDKEAKAISDYILKTFK